MTINQRLELLAIRAKELQLKLIEVNITALEFNALTKDIKVDPKNLLLIESDNNTYDSFGVSSEEAHDKNK